MITGYTIERRSQIGEFILEVMFQYPPGAPHPDRRLFRGSPPWRCIVRPPNWLERLLGVTLEYKLGRAERQLQRYGDAEVKRAAEWAAIERMFTVGHGETGGGGRRPDVPPPPAPVR
jgi:hypothetical protein